MRSDIQFQLRLPPSEKAAFLAAAQDANLSLTAWIRLQLTKAIQLPPLPPSPRPGPNLCPRCSRLSFPACSACLSNTHR